MKTKRAYAIFFQMYTNNKKLNVQIVQHKPAHINQ